MFRQFFSDNKKQKKFNSQNSADFNDFRRISFNFEYFFSNFE